MANLSTSTRHVLERLTGVVIQGPRSGAFAPRAGVDVASTRAAVELTQTWIPIDAKDAGFLEFRARLARAEPAERHGIAPASWTALRDCTHLFRITVEMRRRTAAEGRTRRGWPSWYIEVLRASTPREAQTRGLRTAVEGALVALDAALASGGPWQRLEATAAAARERLHGPDDERAQRT